jgi:sulfite oxidase
MTVTDKSLQVKQADPYNASPSLLQLRRALITPQPLFFVRSHGTIPPLEWESHRLSVDGLVQNPASFSMDELIERFPSIELTATLECAGNRRQELIDHQPIPNELPWGAEAISTAAWKGIRLRDVLEYVGVSEDAQHVEFVGGDEVSRGGKDFHYAASIPLEKALEEEALLVYEMNGEPLTPIHGAPLRGMVPGFIGARSVKWLGNIHLRTNPSPNYFQQRSYKLFPPTVSAETVDWSEGEQLEGLNINTVICVPFDGYSTRAGKVVVKGYSITGGGNKIEKVEVSPDGGRSWLPAKLEQPEPWAWAFWEITLNLVPGTYQIIARAQDEAGNTQPDEIAPIWNFKGYMNNAWHCITLSCE